MRDSKKEKKDKKEKLKILCSDMNEKKSCSKIWVVRKMRKSSWNIWYKTKYKFSIVSENINDCQISQ